MQEQKIIVHSDFAPSFSCYYSDSVTALTIAKVIREETGDKDFEFSLVLSDEKHTTKETDSRFSAVFPASSANTSPLGKLFILEQEDSSSYSSSETEELESPRSKTYCQWRRKADGITKCKKSSSTGSGSKRWIFRCLLRRSNSEGKQPMVLLTPKKVDDSPKQKRNSSEVSKAKSSVHEQFYVQRRAENEVAKRKTYLPYRKDVGLFVNVNRMGKMLPF